VNEPRRLSLPVLSDPDRLRKSLEASEARAAGRHVAQPPSAVSQIADADEASAFPGGTDPLRAKIIDVLKTIYDPEIPVNIYELGLIYDIRISPEREVNIRMTLTAPACPVAETLPPQVEAQIQSIPEVKSAVVDLVWDPPWDREMMSEEARLELGL